MTNNPRHVNASSNQSTHRQRPAARLDRRPVPARKPRACAGDRAARWPRSTAQASASASSTRPASTRRTAPALERRARPRAGQGPADPGRGARDVRRAGADRRARRRSNARRPPRRSTCCRSRPSCAARPTCWSPPAKTGRAVNVKKGQFLAPWDMKNVAAKIARRRQRQRAAVRARRQLRLQHAGQRHARAADPGARPAIRSCSTPRIRCSSRAGRARPAAASANSSRCWRAPPSRSASPPSSWRRTRTPTTRRPTAPTWCRSRTCRRVLETLLAFDKIAKSRPIENIAP